MLVFLFVLYLTLIFLIFYVLSRVCTQYFVFSLELLARKLKLSEDIAGATLMALGGSAPEFTIVAISLLRPGDHANFGAGTIVGSAIFNILVVVGIAAILHTAQLSWRPVVRDVVFYIVAILVLFLIFQDGQVFWYEALSLVALYAVYIVSLVGWQKFIPKKDKEVLLDELSESEEHKIKKNKRQNPLFFIDYFLEIVFVDLEKNPKYYLQVFIQSLIFIGVLSWGMVEFAIRLSQILNIHEAFIALTVVAIGTSVPDLIAASFMAKRGHGGMAIADALGSNIFDILFGFGLPWLLYTLITQSAISVSTENLRGSIILLSATVFLIFLLLLLRHFKIGRPVGFVLLFCYGGYLIFTICEVLKLI